MRITYVCNSNITIDDVKIDKGTRVTMLEFNSEYVVVSPVDFEKSFKVKVPTKVFLDNFEQNEII